ncbi:MAG: hypothetical protein ACOC93_06195, partial [Planctomycetota bacterium]
MTGRNLPLKFGLVALLIALSIWSISARGLQQGIDIRGGHSLTFEFEPIPGVSADQVVATLRRRLDPRGLRNLEFRPQGNRIEIRMPAGSEESRQVKASFQDAMDEIEATNIERSDIQYVLAAETPEQRQEAITQVLNSIARGDAEFRQDLQEILAQPLRQFALAEQELREA